MSGQTNDIFLKNDKVVSIALYKYAPKPYKKKTEILNIFLRHLRDGYTEPCYKNTLNSFVEVVFLY